MRNKFFLLFFVAFFPITIMALENTSRQVTVGKVDREEEVMSIDIDWNNMYFIYTKEENYYWDESAHKYIKEEPKYYWNNNSINININNKSTKSISLKPLFSKSLSYIEGIFNTSNLIIDKKSSGKVSFSISGSLPSKYTSYTKAGVITLQFE